MKSKSTSLFGIVIASVLMSVAHLAIAQNANEDIPSRLQQMDHLTAEEQKTLAEEVIEQRLEVTQALILDLSSSNINTRYYVASLLGEYRDMTAVYALNKVIKLEDADYVSRSRFTIWFWGRYPAVDALVSIGDPSLPVLEDNLATSDDPEIRELSLYSIAAVEHSADVTRAELLRIIKLEKNEARKRRLELALHSVTAQISLLLPDVSSSTAGAASTETKLPVRTKPTTQTSVP